MNVVLSAGIHSARDVTREQSVRALELFGGVTAVRRQLLQEMRKRTRLAYRGPAIRHARLATVGADAPLSELSASSQVMSTASAAVSSDGAAEGGGDGGGGDGSGEGNDGGGGDDDPPHGGVARLAILAVLVLLLLGTFLHLTQLFRWLTHEARDATLVVKLLVAYLMRHEITLLHNTTESIIARLLDRPVRRRHG